MSQISYVPGSATDPYIGEGPKIIVHCCNDVGKWGPNGFSVALSHTFGDRDQMGSPEREYLRWFKSKSTVNPPEIHGRIVKFDLGKVQFVKVKEDRGNEWFVANLIGQHGIEEKRALKPPIRMECIRRGLQEVAAAAKKLKGSMACPRFGSKKAGGDWTTIETAINETVVASGIEVVVYDYTAPRR